MPESDAVEPTPAAALECLVNVVKRLPSAPSVPGAEGTVPADELLAALVRLHQLREQLTHWEPQLIEAARAAGVSWIQLAPALGVTSRQAAERRYLRLNPHASQPELTGEQRVRAARDQRAGDRAVAVWARDNAADLRQVAGQIAALDGLNATAQASADAVHDALGNDDSAALLEPLAAAGEQLTENHPALADRISELGARSDEARRSGRNRHQQSAESKDDRR